MDDMINKIQEILNDEESMNQIKKLSEMLASQNPDGMPDLSSMSGGNNSENEGAPFDFSKIMVLQEILAEANNKDKNSEFLYALKPLLKSESQVKVDKIVKLLKLMAMWPLIKDSGILGGDLFDIL